MAARFTVAVTDDRYGSYAEEKAVLTEIGADLVVNDFKNEDEAIAGLAGADGILVNLFPVNRRVIESLGRCRVLSRYGVGYDNVDVAAMNSAGIPLCYIPDYCAEEVAEQAIAMLMM